MSNTDIKNINTIRQIISVENINTINLHLTQRLDELIKDLKINNVTEFNKLIQKESIASRLLGYRFAGSMIMKTIVGAVSTWLKDNDKQGKWYFSPLIYPRICRPNYEVIRNPGLLYTEPHYDKIEGLNPFWGVWLPLEEVNDQTGSLCHFDIPNDVKEKYFPASKKNYTLKTYIKDSELIDKIVAPYMKTISAKPGDVIFFNEKCLHGATKPTNGIRKSINFQMIHESTVDKLSLFEQLKILFVNKYLDQVNLINLYNLGDTKFVKRNQGSLEQIKIAEEPLIKQIEIIKDNLSKLPESMPTQDNLKNVLPWNHEFIWLKDMLGKN